MPMTGKKGSIERNAVSTVHLKKGVSTAQLKKGDEDEFEEWKKSRQLLKPPNQLVLADADLKEEYARVLTPTHIQMPDNLVEFNYAAGCFLPVPLPGNTVWMIMMRGTRIHVESEEAKKQMALSGELPMEDIIDEEPEEPIAVTEEKKEGEEGEDEGEGEEGEEGEDEDEGEGAETGGGDDEEEAPAPAGAKKKITNQFNFCERDALTYNNPCRSQETQTLPPPRATYSAQAQAYIIFDTYAEDYAAQQREKEKEKKVLITHKKVAKKKKQTDESEEMHQRMFVAWKTLERMVNLNTYDDIAKDYRYWEDPCDEFSEDTGTVLPLWKFNYEKTKKNMITDISWNPWYYDLFAVCFGSFDFLTPMPGAMCLFTIKNPSHPEHICLTECGVMCVDIHPKFPFMIVIGLYDGNVLVYNVTVSCTEPQYKSNAVLNKHSGIVWDIKWGPDTQEQEMNFYSAASDGKINYWVLMQNDLSLTTILTLMLDKKPVSGPDGQFIKLKAAATCMIFHPTEEQIYLVGTEEGFIYKCNILYSSRYLFTYVAHDMPVYRIDFNKYNNDIFISCSGDWRIKIWENCIPTPLYVFDMGSSIGDVKWAPYSSTIFAAVTATGELDIYDLNINKYIPVCKQNIVSKKKKKLTRLSFNYHMPIIMVGDDKGCSHTLKLSPNLRIPCKAPKKMQHMDQFTLQCMKLDKLLSLVREPPVLTPPPDVESRAEF